MRVLMINVVCGIRSTGRICTDLAAALEAQGHEVKIAYGRENVPEQFQKYAVRIGNNFDVYIHAGFARLNDSAGFHSTWYTKHFIKWMERFNPDVIHLHNIHGYYLNVEVLFQYLKSCNKRIIWTLHDCWAFTGHAVFCDAMDCKKWQTSCSRCPQKSEYPKSYIDNSKKNWKKKRTIFTNVPNLQIVTPSYWLAALTAESYLKDYPVTVIHNGIDTKQFYPLENDFREFYHLEKKCIVLAVTDTWNDRKGLSDYVKLAGLLDDRFKIVMVGLTRNQIKELPSNIMGLERTASTKELAMIYSASDVLLNLTYTDTYPTVNLEAVACGTPVITYKTGGSPEAAGEDVRIVKRGDVEKVKDTLEEFIGQISERRIIKKNSAQDSGEAVKKYFSEYNKGYFRIKLNHNLMGKKVVLAVSALWEPRKGLHDVIKLAELINCDYKLIVIGVSDKQKRKLPESVIAISRTNNTEELRQWYSIADVFINPTYEDNYPTTNLEAIACGTPVVTYDTGGSGESIKNTNGLIIREGYSKLKPAIDDILDNRKLAMNNQSENDYIEKSEAVKKYIGLY